jgi:mono/diheme cytochrome c family protein
MPRSRRLRLLAAAAVLSAAVMGACGDDGIQLAKSDPDYRGAELFAERCSGCHTLSVAGTEGSATQVNSREYKDGPSFDQRKEERDQILYAIYNGGYSSGPMPQDIVTGEDAEAVADFLAKYSGRQAEQADQPGAQDSAGTEE